MVVHQLLRVTEKKTSTLAQKLFFKIRSEVAKEVDVQRILDGIRVLCYRASPHIHCLGPHEEVGWQKVQSRCNENRYKNRKAVHARILACQALVADSPALYDSLTLRLEHRVDDHNPRPVC